MPSLIILVSKRLLGRPDAGMEHRAKKSTTARMLLIDAVTGRFVRDGYAKLSNLQVGKGAGLCRGAMLHHFENGATPIHATLFKLNGRLLRAFRRTAHTDYCKYLLMIDAHWGQVQKPAFSDLELVPRTDGLLVRIFKSLQIGFRRPFASLATDIYPEATDQLR